MECLFVVTTLVVALKIWDMGVLWWRDCSCRGGKGLSDGDVRSQKCSKYSLYLNGYIHSYVGLLLGGWYSSCSRYCKLLITATTWHFCLKLTNSLIRLWNTYTSTFFFFLRLTNPLNKSFYSTHFLLLFKFFQRVLRAPPIPCKRCSSNPKVAQEIHNKHKLNVLAEVWEGSRCSPLRDRVLHEQPQFKVRPDLSRPCWFPP